MIKPDFIHIFIPSSEILGKESEHSNKVKYKLQLHPVCLLLLHGTGGDENDLIPMARMLSADASLLSIRGKVLEKR